MEITQALTTLQNIKVDIKSALMDAYIYDPGDKLLDYPDLIRTLKGDFDGYSLYFEPVEGETIDEEVTEEHKYIYKYRKMSYKYDDSHFVKGYLVEKEYANPLVIETTSTELQYRDISNICVEQNLYWTSTNTSILRDDVISTTDLTENDISSLNITMKYWAIDDENATGILNYNLKRLKYLNKPIIFYYMPNLSHIDNIIYGSYPLNYAFAYLRHNIDLSNLTIDLTGIKDIERMFYYSEGITKLPVFIGDNSGIKSLKYVFFKCKGLTSIDLSPFAGCPLKTIGLSFLFNGCSGLTSIDLSPFSGYTGLTSLENIFYGCSGLTSIDLSPFSGYTGLTSLVNTFGNCI